MASPQVGGSFAPPLSDAKLAGYGTLIDSLPTSPIKDALVVLHKCCAKWWQLPEPKDTQRSKHPSGRGVIVTLSKEHADTLFDAIPWTHELDAMQSLFDGIDPVGERDLRNAAFHLLWHVKELNLDREPLTSDKL